eukprot:PhM_4_TR2157/c0_g1_i1/m.64323
MALRRHVTHAPSGAMLPQAPPETDAERKWRKSHAMAMRDHSGNTPIPEDIASSPEGDGSTSTSPPRRDPEEIKRRLRSEYHEKKAELRRVLHDATLCLKERLKECHGVQEEDLEHPCDCPGLGTSAPANTAQGKLQSYEAVPSTGYVFMGMEPPGSDVWATGAGVSPTTTLHTSTTLRSSGTHTVSSSVTSPTKETPRPHLPVMYKRVMSSPRGSPQQRGLQQHQQQHNHHHNDVLRGSSSPRM